MLFDKKGRNNFFSHQRGLRRLSQRVFNTAVACAVRPQPLASYKCS